MDCIKNIQPIFKKGSNNYESIYKRTVNYFNQQKSNHFWGIKNNTITRTAAPNIHARTGCNSKKNTNARAKMYTKNFPIAAIPDQSPFKAAPTEPTTNIRIKANICILSPHIISVKSVTALSVSGILKNYYHNKRQRKDIIIHHSIITNYIYIPAVTCFAICSAISASVISAISQITVL